MIDAFLEGHVSKLTRATKKSYGLTLRKLRSAHGGLKAEALRRAHVEAVHGSLAHTPYLANRLLSAVSSLYVWAEANGYVPADHPNPAIKIRRFPEQGRERFLTGEELGRLGEALRQAETKYPYPVAAIRVLLMSGARVNEILHARWSWLDTERGLLNLPTSKTGRKSIFLPAPALAILLAFRVLKATLLFSPATFLANPVTKCGNHGRRFGEPPVSTICGFMT